MSESNFSRDAVDRVLQVTRQSWLQTPAQPSAMHRAHTASAGPLGSHRSAALSKAPSRSPWGLQVATRQPHRPQA